MPKSNGQTETAPKTRAARRDVEQAFQPIATSLKLSFVPGETPDYNKAGTVYIEGAGKGGNFRAVQVTDQGGTIPVLRGLNPMPAADLVNVYQGISAVIPMLAAA
jgi:hypothetical protein